MIQTQLLRNLIHYRSVVTNFPNDPEARVYSLVHFDQDPLEVAKRYGNRLEPFARALAQSVLQASDRRPK